MGIFVFLHFHYPCEGVNINYGTKGIVKTKLQWKNRYRLTSRVIFLEDTSVVLKYNLEHYSYVAACASETNT